MENIKITIRTKAFLKEEIKIISSRINKNFNDTCVELIELGILEIKKINEENVSEKLNEILLILKEIRRNRNNERKAKSNRIAN